jgi:hypothetical protein
LEALVAVPVPAEDEAEPEADPDEAGLAVAVAAPPLPATTLEQNWSETDCTLMASDGGHDWTIHGVAFCAMADLPVVHWQT